jgi:tRNA G18 (ribose-2'-O)-methylase SpoU
VQLTHKDHITTNSISKDIIILCDHVKGPANLGSIFRLADAFGVTEIFFATGTLDVSSNRLKKTARHTHEKVRFRESEQCITTLEELHLQGYTSIAIEITDTSIPLQTLPCNTLEKVVLIIGDENFGISDDLLAMVTFTAHIPMLGTNSSMNVAQALGIALYELTRT